MGKIPRGLRKPNGDGRITQRLPSLASVQRYPTVARRSPANWPISKQRSVGRAGYVLFNAEAIDPVVSSHLSNIWNGRQRRYDTPANPRASIGHYGLLCPAIGIRRNRLWLKTAGTILRSAAMPCSSTSSLSAINWLLLHLRQRLRKSLPDSPVTGRPANCSTPTNEPPTGGTAGTPRHGLPAARMSCTSLCTADLNMPPASTTGTSSFGQSNCGTNPEVLHHRLAALARICSPVP